MKTPEIRSYRFRKNYKFTPLFWKLSVLAVVVVGLVSYIFLLGFPFSSVSIASASDMESVQDADLSVDLPPVSSSAESQDTTGKHSVSAAPTDTAIENKTPGDAESSNANSNAPPSTEKTQPSSPDSSSGAAHPQTPPVSNGLFSKTAFIGDSRTEGLLLYSGVKGATDYATKGLNLKSVFSSTFVVGESGNKVTILTDMKSKSFDKIYISFGLNELGWSSDVFAKKYKELVSQVRAAQPNAAIYLQSTFPINPDRCRFDQNTNKRIQEMNSQVGKIASDMSNVYYVDMSAQFKDSRGYLLLEASSDGIHLNKKYCIYWLKCLEKNLEGTLPPAPETPPAVSQQSDIVSPSASEIVVPTESATQISPELTNE